MGVGVPMVPARLHTLFGGELGDEFERLLPILVGGLKEGQKASVSITVTFERVKDTESMITSKYRMSPKFPPAQKAALCRIGDDGELRTEAKTEQLIMFGKDGQEEHPGQLRIG